MKENKTGITGIVLAGGKSSRMGQEKGLILYRGKPLAMHMLDLLRPLCDHLLLSANDSRYRSFGVTVVPDLVEDAGPLAGLAAGLAASPTEGNLVVPCDTPFLNRDLLEYLLSHTAGHEVIIPLDPKGQPHPLCGYYSRSILPAIEEQLKKNERKVLRLLEEVNTLSLPVKESLPFYHARLFANINTPDDLVMLG